MKEIIIPRFGDSVEQVTILSWKVKEGEEASLGDVIALLEEDE
jgi:pyruvate/2-oxoglutarate dehydrogenase complex dihydrolipoamide acyltransferase (E2) component